MFDIVRQSTDSQLSLGLGDYQQLDEIIRRELTTLIAIGMKIVVFIDGRNTRLKSDTLEQRREQREAEWDNLLVYLRSPKRLEKNMKFPICPLLQTQFLDSLRGSGITVFECDEEADQSIAKYCSNLNEMDDTVSCFCYGKDSDFFAFRDCPYIELGELKVSKRGSVVASHVWRRSRTAASLEISEKQFVELCILVGNDYTGKILKEEHPQLEESPENQSRIDTILQMIAASGVDFQVSSKDDSFQLAVEFSRDLYDLRDLSKYPYDIRQSVEQFVSLAPTEIVSVAEHFEAFSRSEDSDIVAAILAATSQVDFFSRNEIYISALLEMIVRVRNGETSAPRRSLPTFEEYVAMHMFQLIYHECRKLAQVLHQSPA